MYTPKHFQAKDHGKVVEFMKAFSFGTLVSAENHKPVATQLPFVVEELENKIVLSAHFAKANPQWKALEEKEVLVIFSEPHAYISPTHYDKFESVPTWNYIAVHVYGKVKLITEESEALTLLEKMIQYYEAGYQKQWKEISDDFKSKMIKGIVAFEIEVTEIQATEKLSQNKTVEERERISKSLSNSNNGVNQILGEYMKKKE